MPLATKSIKIYRSSNYKVPLTIQRRSNRRKGTALTLAAKHACRETITTLISLGADIDLVDADGIPALDYAIMSGDSGTVELLCDATYSSKDKTPIYQVLDY